MRLSFYSFAIIPKCQVAMHVMWVVLSGVGGQIPRKNLEFALCINMRMKCCRNDISPISSLWWRKPLVLTTGDESFLYLIWSMVGGYVRRLQSTEVWDRRYLMIGESIIPMYFIDYDCRFLNIRVYSMSVALWVLVGLYCGIKWRLWIIIICNYGIITNRW